MPIFKHNLNGRVARYQPQSGNDSHFELLNEQIVEGVETTWGYHLLVIPEFDLSVRGQELFRRALLRQKMFTDTINQWLRQRVADFTLELRLRNNPDHRTVTCFLLIRMLINNTSDLQSSGLMQAVAEIERMLPEEYNFFPLDLKQLNELLTLPTGTPIHEIRRNCRLTPTGNFAGLHRGNPMVARSGPVHYRNGNVKEPIIGYDPALTYLVPGLTPLVPCDSNWFNLFRILQEAEDVVQIRISLRSEPVFTYDKTLSTQFYGLLMSTYRQTPFVENGVADGFLASMTKLMHADWLYSVQLQVASISLSLSTALATAFMTQITNGNSQALLLVSQTDNPVAYEAWQQCRQLYEPYTGLPKRWSDESEAFLKRIQYLYGDDEVNNLFRLPVADAEGLPGFTSKPTRPFYQIPPRSSDTPSIQLGKVITAGTYEFNSQYHDSAKHRLSDYEVPIRDLTRHGMIVGTPGSGKTNTMLTFASELARNQIPFLLIEPVKSEYFNELKSVVAQNMNQKLLRFDFSRPRLANGELNPDFLRFNPLIPLPGISLVQHISYVLGCISAAFPLFGIMPLVLEDCLLEFYKQDFLFDPTFDRKRDGLKLREDDFFLPEKSPGYFDKKLIREQPGVEDSPLLTIKANHDKATIKNLSHFIGVYLHSNEKLFDPKIRAELEGGLNRRFVKFTKGILGQVFCPENWREAGKKYSVVSDNIHALLNKPCIVELESLPSNEEKALMMAFLLTYLFEDRLLRKSHDPTNQLHITIVEEAHRLLSNSSFQNTGGSENASVTPNGATKSISLFLDMLAEIRAKNEGIFIVEQSPTKLVPDVVKQTNLKIMHRLPTQTDRNYFGEAMNMDEQQRRYATTLKQGEAIVFDEQLDKPLLVKMSKFKK